VAPPTDLGEVLWRWRLDEIRSVSEEPGFSLGLGETPLEVGAEGLLQLREGDGVQALPHHGSQGLGRRGGDRHTVVIVF